MEATAWIWAALWRAGSVTSARGGEDGRTNYLCLALCPGPFLSLVPGRRSSPCGPPRSSRPVSGPPRCAASVPLSTAPSLSPSPSLPGKAGPYPRPVTSSEGVWSWTGRSAEQMEGGEATGSRRLAGKSPLYVSRREGAGRAREDPGARGTGSGWSTGCWASEGSLHEHVMPRAEPSADCWDWPICMQGQRSRGRGQDNLTGRDWSLPGRLRCGVDVG